MSDSNQTPPIKELSKPIDLQGALEEALQKLALLGEPAILLGGVALSYYGLERYNYTSGAATELAAEHNAASQRVSHCSDAQQPKPPLYRVDFAVTTQATRRAEQLLQAYDLKPLRIGGVSFLTTVGVRVDLIDRRVEYQDLFEEMLGMIAKSPKLKLGEHLIAVAPLPYLIACKLIADRPQDEVDLRFLLSLPTLDYAEARALVQRYLGRFGAQYLDKLARAVGRTEPAKEYTPQDS